MSLSDTVAERQPDALVKLATCYYGAENAFAMASLLAGENGSDCGEVFGQLMQLTARRCSEAASWITALVFDHKELWDVVGTETIILLAELRRQNLKADGVLITDRDMRRALHEVIARYGEFVAQWAPLLAENCSQALDALGLSEERLTSIEFAEFQKRGLVRQDFLSGDQDLPK
jgi:hypothetical protein